MSVEYEQNNKDRIPYEHYREEFSKLDPIEASKRCNIPYDQQKQEFAFRLMYRELAVKFPSGEMFYADGTKVEAFNIQILLYRYLLEGRYCEAQGQPLTYRDIPWGEVYFRQFQGRCLIRLAYAFGFKLDKFSEVMEKLGAKKIEMGDMGYQFEFINNLFVSFIIWGGDEEFPPSTQILFEDNFPQAFTAEDIAVVGDISIGILKDMAK